MVIGEKWHGKSTGESSRKCGKSYFSTGWITTIHIRNKSRKKLFTSPVRLS